MSILFTILSVAYVAGIFLWADSPIVEELSAFNPLSLLHIPLYGVLTLLLMFSKLTFEFFNQTNQANSTSPINPINPINPISFLIPGLIAFIVAIADEIHQAYIPGRDASIIDVILDLSGIVLVLIVIHQIRRKKVMGN